VRGKHRQTWPTEHCCWLLPAVMLLFGLSSGGDASASWFSGSHGFDAEKHADYCQCGPKCRRESCCCGPREMRASRRADPAPKLPVSDATHRPCLSSAPCSDPGLPTASSVGPTGKVAMLALCEHLRSSFLDSLLPPPSSCHLPSKRASRIEEPPEQDALA
jgi:hypothetical protein